MSTLKPKAEIIHAVTVVLDVVPLQDYTREEVLKIAADGLMRNIF